MVGFRLSCNASLRCWMRRALDIALLVLVCASVAIPLQLDRWTLGVFLTYGPRPLIAFATFVILLIVGFQRSLLRLLIAVMSIACCLGSIDWGGAKVGSSASELNSIRIVSMNIHGHASSLRQYLDDAAIAPDLLCLQEVTARQRQQLVDSFPEFDFYSMDSAPRQQVASYFPSCLTGVRRDRFDANVQVYPAITDYRSFAVEVMDSQTRQSLAVVNVHTTKALALHGPRAFFIRTPAKAIRHRDERRMLERWIGRQSHPVVLAGDFNAPSGTMGVRLQGTQNAHAVAGQGPLLTFPSAMPIVGIDHVLGTSGIEFVESRVLGESFSDHCGRYVEFFVSRQIACELRSRKVEDACSVSTS